ncbi:Hint domain-containing protein [Gymnodinialimonas ulvae]|uniref:Hint domain-containing protein n=1 Tax=Gymnodinialimonas ulvae TaxID=3126504 RepID=UPI00309CD9C8
MLPVQTSDGHHTPAKDRIAQTIVIRDGHGSDRLSCFDPATDVIAFDMAEISGYPDVLSRMLERGGNTTITFDSGDRLTVAKHPRSHLTPANFAYSAGPISLHEGTPIRTERGDIPIEYLRPDDIVWTKDHGWQAIRIVTFERMRFHDRDDPAKPIFIPAGALGSGKPSQDLITSPQHRVLQVLTRDGAEMLVPAVDLVGQNGIRAMRGRKKANYLSLVMERHSVIQAAGCWVESMLITPDFVDRQSTAVQRLLDRCKGMKATRRVEKRGVRPRRLKVG